MKPKYYFITYIQKDINTNIERSYNDLIIESPFEWLKAKQRENLISSKYLNHDTILLTYRQISKTEYDYCRDNIKF